ncbi:leucine rich repeat-containing protein [Cystoisospora suis]|uniref:Leucine rich repeat-containing protein n=1 Tax=Cystoisospora suis TaxID=483139 RepID=A0A2C6L1I9_9APIC|nr:leucine rich repeat-containing protein [Cystoisospora suis]
MLWMRRVWEGISACKELQFLDASFNFIGSIERELTGMRQLHTLRLSANRLADLKGICLAVNLVELHVASNRIEEFGRSLRDNIKLQKLNVASNRFSSFVLAPSACLQVLNKTRLDGKAVQAVAQTYTRKLLYYTTKLQLLKRHFITASRKASALHAENWREKKSLLRHIVFGDGTSSRERKALRVHDDPSTVGINTVCIMAIACAASREHRYPRSDQWTAESGLRKKQEQVLRAALQESLVVSRMVHDTMEELRRRAERSLLWEHESAGNVFLEQGTPAHGW